jgi:hypothetical protein
MQVYILRSQMKRTAATNTTLSLSQCLMEGKRRTFSALLLNLQFNETKIFRQRKSKALTIRCIRTRGYVRYSTAWSLYINYRRSVLHDNPIPRNFDGPSKKSRNGSTLLVHGATTTIR